MKTEFFRLKILVIMAMNSGFHKRWTVQPAERILASEGLYSTKLDS
jgi:hypothetical protein